MGGEPTVAGHGADPMDLPALTLRERIATGAIGAADAAGACLRRIRERDDRIHAWTFVDDALVTQQARLLDAHRQTGRPLGPLHGLPVAIKDIIDTADMPTENGCALDRDRRPATDAVLVRRLRAAGAVLAGKSVTTECAYLAPGPTCNPHDPAHTPGGSSSGSAAAVAAGMVPLAVGTQTGGSVIRPASFCGIVGFKPTFGLIPRTGVLRTSRTLDTVGVFGRTVEDVALLADALAGHDPGDPDSLVTAPPRLLDSCTAAVPAVPVFAFVRTPAWDTLDADCAAGLEELRELLGDRCDEITLPPLFAEAAVVHRRIMLAEIAHNLRPYRDRGGDALRAETRAAIDEGRSLSAADYLAARDWREPLHAGVDSILERYNAIITPAAPGEAPAGLDSTGSASCNLLWTLTGLPAITLPLMVGANGLPIGVQLVGRRNDDGRLLRTARWLLQRLASTDQGDSR